MVAAGGYDWLQFSEGMSRSGALFRDQTVVRVGEDNRPQRRSQPDRVVLEDIVQAQVPDFVRSRRLAVGLHELHAGEARLAVPDGAGRVNQLHRQRLAHGTGYLRRDFAQSCRNHEIEVAGRTEQMQAGAGAETPARTR